MGHTRFRDNAEQDSSFGPGTVVIHANDPGMALLTIIWDETAGGNAQHIHQNLLTLEEVDAVLINPIAEMFSRSSRQPMRLGYYVAGDEIYVVFEWIDDDTVYPVTAFRKAEHQ